MSASFVPGSYPGNNFTERSNTRPLPAREGSSSVYLSIIYPCTETHTVEYYSTIIGRKSHRFLQHESNFRALFVCLSVCLSICLATHSVILLSHKKVKSIVCYNMNVTLGHDAKLDKSDKDKYCMISLKYTI